MSNSKCSCCVIKWGKQVYLRLFGLTTVCPCPFGDMSMLNRPFQAIHQWLVSSCRLKSCTHLYALPSIWCNGSEARILIIELGTALTVVWWWLTWDVNCNVNKKNCDELDGEQTWNICSGQYTRRCVVWQTKREQQVRRAGSVWKTVTESSSV